MQLFYCPGIIHQDFFLSEDESRHCTKVLRHQSGDIIQITDGCGSIYSAELTDISAWKCEFKIIETTKYSKSDFTIHLAIAPTKNIDRIEWFVEKSIEVGVDEITFLQTAHSERNKINLERIRKKAISAMKQSLRSFLPKINDLQKVRSFIEKSEARQKFIAHLDVDSPIYLNKKAEVSSDYLILIGPEGGFSHEEINLAKENGYYCVVLGNQRLRTETAGVVATTILNTINLR